MLVSSALADPSMPMSLQGADPFFMDATGDSSGIKLNLDDVIRSFNFDSPEDQYSQDPFEGGQDEDLLGGSFSLDDSYSWFMRNEPNEDVADSILSDDEPNQDTCDEQDDQTENNEGEDLNVPPCVRLTNPNVQCWLNSSISYVQPFQ